MGKRAKARTSTRAKVLATVAVIGGTAGIAGLGTFGTFTSTTAAQSSTHSTGTVVLDYGAGGTTNRLTTGASLLAAGDTQQRGFTLRNSGSLDYASVKANLSASTSSLLDTDATNGLSLKIEKCSGVGWVESLVTPYTYTCAGTVTTVLADTPVATLIAASGGSAVTGLASTTSGSSDSLRATWTLPSGAANSVQGLSSTLVLDFTATQRAATSK
ncbi:MAG: spore coat-associated protein [Frankiaceae bacterium]|jgi:hypothetical protein|nr:spore coat-associated protein [Frankiaceae bacterium]MDX6226596.1 spore coat-associated protein [Frankiales bacterium]MDX6274203.1 spore coat-associated protein [Frankiales bacterium]